MLEYQIEITREGRMIIHGDIEDNSIAVNLPKDDPDRKEFISLFIIKESIETGIRELRCISDDKTIVVNRALFLSALIHFMKCFQKSKNCIPLKKDIFKNSEDINISNLFTRYEDWRDRHYVHEENSMTETTAFLLIAPECSENKFGGPPSVVWNTLEPNYWEESRELTKLLFVIRDYVCSQIDNVGERIQGRYVSKDKSELISYEQASITAAWIEK